MPAPYFLPLVDGEFIATTTHTVKIVMPMTFGDSASITQGTSGELFGLSGEILAGLVLELGAPIDHKLLFGDSSECLIEYRQEFDEAQTGALKNQIKAQTPDTNNGILTDAVNVTKGQYLAVANALHANLIVTSEAALTGVKFNVAEGYNMTVPYLADKAKFTVNQSLGDFIVEWIAYRIFGHPQATAPISNDTVIIGEVNGRHANPVVGDFVHTVNASALTSGNIAYRLLHNLYIASEDNLVKIVEQVLAQAPERFRDEDSKVNVADINVPGYKIAGWQPLEWATGDVIYFKIKVADFDRFIMKDATNSAGSTLATAAAGLTAKGAEFYLKVTLS